MTLCMRVVGQYRDDFTGLLPSEISTGLPWLLVNYPEIDVPRSTRAAGETGAIQDPRGFHCVEKIEPLRKES